MAFQGTDLADVRPFSCRHNELSSSMTSHKEKEKGVFQVITGPPLVPALRRVVLHQLEKIAVVTILIGTVYLISGTILWLPISILAAIGVHYISCLFFNTASSCDGAKSRRLQRDIPAAAIQTNMAPPLPPTSVNRNKEKPLKSGNNSHWRSQVRSAVVEHAWDTLCGSIVQEFIYDTWYAMLTPDREFPAEIRRLLNYAFGTLASRARHLDLRDVLEDGSELFMETIELYRDTREAVVSASPEKGLQNMTAAARDRAFLREMKAEKNLHPALMSPDGHYKVLRAVSDGVVGCLLELEPSSDHGVIRAVARELLSGAVFRPLLMWCSPYYANKAMFALLKDRESASPVTHGGVRRTQEYEDMKGRWEFEQRLLTTAQAENAPSPTPRQHSRSRSFDEALLIGRGQERQRNPVGKVIRHDTIDVATAGPITIGEEKGEGAINDFSFMTTTTLGKDSPQESAASSPMNGGRVMPKPSPFESSSEEGSEEGPSRTGSIQSHAIPSLSLPCIDAQGSHLIAPSASSARIRESSTPQGQARLQMQEQQHIGFVGRPRARVVAADLHASTFKDYVVYRIRVSDDAKEWTVSRRYRHFEVLHRQLKVYTGYKLKLPPKRIFFHSQTVDFVEERREALDKYLQLLLQNRQLAACSDVWEFLRSGSEVYEVIMGLVDGANLLVVPMVPPSRESSLAAWDTVRTQGSAMSESVRDPTRTQSSVPSGLYSFDDGSGGILGGEDSGSGTDRIQYGGGLSSQKSFAGRLVGPIGRAATSSAKKLRTVLTIQNMDEFAVSPSKKSQVRRSKSRSNSPEGKRSRKTSRPIHLSSAADENSSDTNNNGFSRGALPVIERGQSENPHTHSPSTPPSIDPHSHGLISFPSLNPEDCTGISSPLYEIIDCLFQLQRKGFFRRQVFGVARQMLSLVAGDAIDVFLVNQLRILRQEHTIARVIHRIQNSLWPGGVWFSYLQQKFQTVGGEEEGGGRGRSPPTLMQSDRYLQATSEPPKDADEVKEAVRELMFKRAPLPLVRLVGKGAYIEGMNDLYEMMQSEVFMYQLGYGALEIAIVHVFPELRGLFGKIEHPI